MPHSLFNRALLTALWLVAFAGLLRWWDFTNRLPGLLLWTCVFLVLFLVTAFLLYGSTTAERHKEVWSPVHLWLGLIIVTLIAHSIVPTFRAHGEVVQTVIIVGVLDFVLPVWIGLHTVALVWGPLTRTVVLVLLVPAFLVFAWAYMIRMPGNAHSGPLPALTNEEMEIRRNVEQHVHALAGEIGERNYIEFHALERAAQYIENALGELGYDVSSHYYDIGAQRFRNLEAALVGSRYPEEIVVVGGHYDSVEGAPGADDNASGVAAVLELARMFRSESPERTVQFVFFVNEEPPHFNTRLMGSRVYAARAARASDKIVAMMSLESIGYYSDKPKSQQYPFPFSLFYPDRGDFIGFVANLASRSLVRRSMAVFRETTAFPAHGVASPSWIPGISWSDQASFWLHGYKAIMISDTAPFRNPYYHTLEDTPDKLDYDRMARVVAGVARVVRDLAGEMP